MVHQALAAVTAEDLTVGFFSNGHLLNLKLVSKSSESGTWQSGFPARLQDSYLIWMIQGVDCQEEEEVRKNEPDIRNSLSLGKDRGSEEILW